MSHGDEKVEMGLKLFLKRYKPSDIARELNVSRPTVYSWIKKHHWQEMLSHEGPLAAAGRRLESLMGARNIDDQHLKAIDQATNVYERLRKLEVSYSTKALAGATGNNKAQENRDNAGESKTSGSRKNNDFSEFTADEIEQAFFNGLFQFQIKCWDERKHRTRMYLKARQIGFTFYFSREGLADALINGRNKVFLSASRAQADIFRDYMQLWANQAFGIELKGKDKIKVRSEAGEAIIYLLSTNVSTAQGPSGDCYIDEFFWIANFKKLNKVASAVATQKQWRKTYFSTPSVESHDAFPLWNMQNYNDERQAANEPTASLPKKLNSGRLCKDGIYRRIVTVDDAVAGGCHLIDIEQLKREYSKEEFMQLFMCVFMSDMNSVFKLKLLEKCLIDSAGWRDYMPTAERPFGNREVWIGYDPSRNIDGAAIAVLAPPLTAGGKFRVLLRIQMRNQSWQYQAQVIKELTEKFNVKHIGIDITGIGSGVFELVQKFFPTAVPIVYSTATKNQLVIKAQDVIDHERICWDPIYSDIAAGFMAIRRTTTKNNNVTYIADRSAKIGHADSAWAVMHALNNEPLAANDPVQSTYAMG